jgi:hypothetical protein
MTIEIHQPELEALIQQRMASGAFHDVEEVLIYALKSAPPTDRAAQGQESRKVTLEEMFAKARGLLTEEEAGTLFRRDTSPGRPVDLS